MDEARFLEEVQDLIHKTVEDYFLVFQLFDFSPYIEVVNNVADGIAGLRPALFEKDPALKEQYTHAAGAVIPPGGDRNMFTVLLNMPFFMESMEREDNLWLDILARQLTRCGSAIEYAKLCGNDDYDEVFFQPERHTLFCLWAEYDAAYAGHLFARMYRYADTHDRAQVPHIVKTELPAQMQLMKGAYGAAANDFDKICSAARFLGHLAAWQSLFPEDFTWPAVNALLDNIPWMWEWFHFLRQFPHFEDAYKAFEQMEGILRGAFPDTFPEEGI